MVKNELKKRKKTSTDENKVKAGTTGVIEAVVKIINTHIENGEICEYGCWVLWTITFNNSKS